jgi:ATP-dependent helicase/nuclease subunit A
LSDSPCYRTCFSTRDGTVLFDECLGVRQRKVYGEDHGQPHIYDNWRWDVLKCCRPTEHDEERRLLYVAMTRARDHIVFTAGEEPSTFLEELPVEIESYEPDVGAVSPGETVQSRFEVAIPEPEGPIGYSPHSLMDDSVFEAVEEGRGPEFGSYVHDFAERYALDEPAEVGVRGDDDTRHVKALLDSMDGKLRVEEDAYLPLAVDGERVTIHGVVDLVHVTDEAVEVVDYKTDLERHAEVEYRTQLSVYYYVLSEAYPDRAVTASLFFTAEGERVTIEPLSKGEIRTLVRTKLNGKESDQIAL